MSGETVTTLASSTRAGPPPDVLAPPLGGGGVPGSTLSGEPILLVEDDQDIREAVAELLEMEGYRTVVSTNGQEALERLHHMERPCLILLDVMMPVMDGYAFMAKLQHEAPLADIPVVITSASHHPPEGARACVNKPFDLMHLLAVVKRFCG
jgi:CheY-like chemotaxis protein